MKLKKKTIGLGTSTSKEAKEYFSDMGRHRIQFRYKGNDDDKSIELAFSRKMIEDRKRWLTDWMEERKRRKENGLPDVSHYNLSDQSELLSNFASFGLSLMK